MRGFCTRGILRDVTREVSRTFLKKVVSGFISRKETVTMSRTFQTLGTCVVLAAVFVVAWVMLPPPKSLLADECIAGCAPSTPACFGDTTGSCPGCDVLGTGGTGCNNAPGLTFYTGASVSGGDQGTSRIKFNNVPCKQKRPCIVRLPNVGGQCSTGPFGAVCGGTHGSCTRCELGAAFTISIVYDCEDIGCT